MSDMNYLKNLSPLGEMLTNKSRSFVHNPALLNLQSLIMASLVLVINRTAIANYSAVKAKDTPDGPYRTHEAYRTTIREFLGFTGGFVVLRQLQGWIKGWVGDAIGVEEKTNPNNYKLWDAFKKWWKNPTHKATPFEPNFTADLTPKVKPGELEPWAKRCIAAARVFKPEALTERTAIEAYLRQVHKVAPIVLASIPTVALAGVLLEKFTRDHADNVADFIGAHFGGHKGGDKKSPKPAAPVAPAPFNALSPAPVTLMKPPSFGANPPLPFNRINPNITAANAPWTNQRINPMPSRQSWPNPTFG